MKGKSILITGVSSGIGLACAKKLLQEGYTVFGSLRSKNEEIERTLSEIGPFHSLYFDVQDKESIQNAFEEVRNIIKNKPFVGLVNNAGYALPGPLLHLDDHEIQQQLDVNVVGIIRVTNAFFPLLKSAAKNHQTKIINISSTAASFTNPFLGAYAMSKHAVESLTDAYRREFLDYNIDVISIRPGPIKTEIWKKSKGKLDRFKDTDYAQMLKKADNHIQSIDDAAMPVEHVGNLVYDVFKNTKPKTRYTIMKKAWALKLTRMLPDRLLDRIIWKQLKK